MSTGHPTGHGHSEANPGEAPAAPDTACRTAGQATGQSTGHTGTPEHRRTSPPLVGGVCRSGLILELRLARHLLADVLDRLAERDRRRPTR